MYLPTPRSGCKSAHRFIHTVHSYDATVLRTATSYSHRYKEVRKGVRSTHAPPSSSTRYSLISLHSPVFHGCPLRFFKHSPRKEFFTRLVSISMSKADLYRVSANVKFECNQVPFVSRTNRLEKLPD